MKITWSRWKKLLSIAWPLIVANSFWNLQMTIDRVFLGTYSTEALGAAMTVMGVFWTPMALLQQTAAYVTTFVAQYFGSKKMEKIGPAVWQSLYISVIGGILFCLLIFLSDDFFAFINHQEIVRELEIDYFNAISYSALPTALVAAFSGFFTGLGNTRVVMAINGVGLLFNAFFDYLLIFGNWGFPELGIEGAGYATTIAGFASAAFAALLVFRRKFEEQYKIISSWRWDPQLLRRFIRYGLPSGLQWALEGLAFTVFLIVIGRFANGTAALASSSIAVTIMMLSILPALGVAQAVMALVGQHLGEKRPDLAVIDTHAGVQVSALYIGVMSLSFCFFPEFYLGWFENRQNIELWSEVVVIGRYLLFFVAGFTLFDAMNLNFSFALKGAGDTRFVSLMALIIPWPIMVVPTAFLTDQPGAVYWAWGFATAYAIAIAIVFWLRFRGGRWKTMSVIRDSD